MNHVVRILVCFALPAIASCTMCPSLPYCEQLKSQSPRAGETAPTFKLASLDGKRSVDLAGFRGHKPVLLLFGSYT